ncbi:MAG TPA: ABC transporter permease subunit [Actinomycetota bacterium]|nr:ABC transporter permease subunit [Actinomycetota bacterium]
MTWVAWRQFRIQAVLAAAGLAVIAGVLAVTGPHLLALYRSDVVDCASSGTCNAGAFQNSYRGLQLLSYLLLALPGVIGAFWGAPLVARELESGTFRLAWTQGVTRSRWLVRKLGVLGLATAATTGLVSLALTWWSSPLDRVAMDRFQPGLFGARNIAPVGYALFGFALGVALGVLLRRTIPAMFATLAGFAVTRLVFASWVDPHLWALKHAVHPITVAFNRGKGAGISVFFGGSPPGSWVISGQTVNAAGQALSGGPLPACMSHFGPANPPSGAAARACLAGYHQVISYQPASRYWGYQWADLAIFTGLAMVLAAASVWWVRRHPG